jgi:predicted glycosyltransferase
VLATAGGGEDGFPLLDAFVRAAAGADWDGVVVAGPSSARNTRRRLKAAAERAGVTFHAAVPDVARLFGSVDAIVCMGGYNTLTEAAASGTPTVCVPRVVPRTEQLLRARAFESMGLVRVIDPRTLTPDALRGDVEAALHDEPVDRAARAESALGLDGASRAADVLLELARPAQALDRVPVSVAR